MVRTAGKCSTIFGEHFNVILGKVRVELKPRPEAVPKNPGDFGAQAFEHIAGFGDSMGSIFVNPPSDFTYLSPGVLQFGASVAQRMGNVVSTK